MSRLTFAATVIGILFGLAAGVGSYTFIYAEGGSYLGHDSAACANCHVMRENYDGWIKSSHRAVAECNDCHTPHEFFAKYATKALNGWNHSRAFTTGNFEEPIRIKPRNREVLERACRYCHEPVVRAMIAGEAGHAGVRGEITCVRCHGSVGHAELGPAGDLRR